MGVDKPLDLPFAPAIRGGFSVEEPADIENSEAIGTISAEAEIFQSSQLYANI